MNNNDFDKFMNSLSKLIDTNSDSTDNEEDSYELYDMDIDDQLMEYSHYFSECDALYDQKAELLFAGI